MSLEIIIVVITAFFGFAGYFIQNSINTRNRNREKRKEIYSNFIIILEEIFIKKNTSVSLQEKMMEFNLHSMFYLNPKLIQNLLKFRSFAQEGEKEKLKLIECQFDIIKNMRADLGLSNKNISSEDLAALIINDTPENIKKLWSL